MKKTILSTLVAVGLIGGASQSKADTFGSGANAFTIDFVSVGNSGNSADTTGYGAVPYEYRIGKYEISENLISLASINGLQNVTAGAWSGDQPAGLISWFEAAAFVNYLNTSRGFQAAYNLSWNGSAWSVSFWDSSQHWTNGGVSPLRNKDAYYFLPSENEWYKAAYYKGGSANAGYWDFATGSDTAPVPTNGGISANTAVYFGQTNQYEPSRWPPASVYSAGGVSPSGTMGQNGNLYEVTDSPYALPQNSELSPVVRRGGTWVSTSAELNSGFRDAIFAGIGSSLAIETYDGGFRVASVPEPSTYALFGTGVIGMLMVMRRKKESGQAF